MGPVELRVSVVFSPRAGEVDEVELLLTSGSTVADAIAASGMQARHPDHDLTAMPVGHPPAAISIKAPSNLALALSQLY